MSLFTNAADRLLSAVVPHTTAEAAWTCPAGCHRVTCYCLGSHWYNACINNATGHQCTSCRYTSYTC
jgi:hypothetical protein